MIISKSIHPERDLYFLGAKTIEVMSSSDKEEWDCFDLFADLKQKQKISINLFLLVLDWLFILQVIQKSANGRIRKCF
jgi:hypothetical protein